MATSTSLSKANGKFALALFKSLRDEDKTGNIFYSSFSISSALAMVLLGARGNTASQMSEVLCFTEAPKNEETPPTEEKSAKQAQMQTRKQLKKPQRIPEYLRKCLKPQEPTQEEENDNDDIHSEFEKLLDYLNKADAPYALSIANKLYAELSYEFVKEYLAETKEHYKAELETVDFKTEAEAARVKINGWVEERTKGKIKDLLAKEVVDEKTRLVLVNAIYFKGDWLQQFNKESTEDAQFKVNKNDTKPVKMMNQKSEFSFSFDQELKCKVLELPYKGEELSMLIFLPDDIEDDTTGLEKLESELTYDTFLRLTEKLDKKSVQVKLPRFKMEEKYELNKNLIKMGMVDAFDNKKSNFSGMSPADDLVLSKVVHKAYCGVDEEGAEAAGATAAVIIERTSVVIPETFNADHPFLFFIRQSTETSNTILFAGRFCHPED